MRGHHLRLAPPAPWGGGVRRALGVATPRRSWFGGGVVALNLRVHEGITRGMSSGWGGCGGAGGVAALERAARARAPLEGAPGASVGGGGHSHGHRHARSGWDGATAGGHRAAGRASPAATARWGGWPRLHPLLRRGTTLAMALYAIAAGWCSTARRPRARAGRHLARAHGRRQRRARRGVDDRCRGVVVRTLASRTLALETTIAADLGSRRSASSGAARRRAAQRSVLQSPRRLPRRSHHAQHPLHRHRVVQLVAAEVVAVAVPVPS